MGARPLSPLGQQFMAGLPPVLRSSSDYEACMHTLAREFDRLAGVIEQTRAQFNPASADLLLSAWEQQVRLPVGGAGASVAQRQQRVLSRLQRMLLSSEGREWEDQVTRIVGQGWTYQEHDPADGTSPPANTLHITLPYIGGTADYQRALAEIREITASHLALTYDSGGGFQLDISRLDVDPLTY